MNIKNFLSGLVFVGVTSLVVLEIYSNLYKKPFLKLVVETQGFKLLFEIKKDPFNKWKKIFVNNKADLIRDNFLPYLTSETSDDEGAYYLNRWCKQVFDSSSWDNLTLWRARRYCTATLGVELLEEENVNLIEELDDSRREEEWGRVFKELKSNIAQTGLIDEFKVEDNLDGRNVALLRDWCGNKLSQSFIRGKSFDKKYVRSWCVTLDTPK